jgi:hypothetical protein
MKNSAGVERLLNLVPIVAAMAIGGGAIALLFAKEASVTPKATQDRKEMKIRSDTAIARSRGENIDTQLRQLVWSEQAEQIEGKALAIANRVASGRGVKILGFRPQKPSEASGLVQVPFVVSVEGAFPSVVGMVDDLGTRSNRLSVTLIQIASADPASDKVSATVGITAFRLPEDAG